MKWKPLIKAGGPLATAAMLASGGYESAPPAVASGPTVIADLNWLTDSGILNMVGAPIENGFYVGTWPWATGGTATSALAIAAGADGGPVYDLTNGVGSDGTGNQALTLPTPVTIPADTDCVIYLKCVLAVYGDMLIGKSNSYASIVFGGNAGWQLLNAAGAGASCYGEPTDATYLARARRSSGVWSFAWTGQAELAADGGGTLGSAAIIIDTILARSTGGSNLDEFPLTGQYLQKLYIYHGSSSPDTAYETANGGIL